jgi:cyclic pyranopterin phosphate synthase
LHGSIFIFAVPDRLLRMKKTSVVSDTPAKADSAASALSHLDEAGQVRMVDVLGKTATARTAVARSIVRMTPRSYAALNAAENSKGEVLNTARVAGVLAAKRCAELIPMCHSLPLTFAGIDFALDDQTQCVTIRATCRSDYKTGVEMEALTACSIAALTIYDMCKAADKGIIIEDTRLEYKSGGKSGEWRCD